jgi:hypothetical protein
VAAPVVQAVPVYQAVPMQLQFQLVPQAISGCN